MRCCVQAENQRLRLESENKKETEDKSGIRAITEPQAFDAKEEPAFQPTATLQPRYIRLSSCLRLAVPITAAAPILVR